MSNDEVKPTESAPETPESESKPTAARKPAARKATQADAGDAAEKPTTPTRRTPAKKAQEPESAATDEKPTTARRSTATKRTGAVGATEGETPSASEPSSQKPAAKRSPKVEVPAEPEPAAAEKPAADKPEEAAAEKPDIPTPTPEPVLPELPAATPSRERAEFNGTGRRVVVAEDEALIRLDVVETLTEAGFNVVGEAGDGERAVALATELKPDVVVMDIKMPVLDGISAAERIGKARIAPVVLLTAFSQAELVERARDAGAMAYVVKPFTPAELLPAIEIAVARHQELTALESEIADLSERFETRKRVERAKGLLMSKMGLTEPESFRWIQKTSMDRRLTMREVADAVIEQVGGGSADKGR